MTVTMEVTRPQALTLQAMFTYWNQLSSQGSSRRVGFYVDGDGNFHPKCQMTFSEPLPELTDELRELAVAVDENGNRLYDFDSIAWKVHRDTSQWVLTEAYKFAENLRVGLPPEQLNEAEPDDKDTIV
jgi:hypothetical protein